MAGLRMETRFVYFEWLFCADHTENTAQIAVESFEKHYLCHFSVC